MPGSGDGDGGPIVKSARLGTNNRFCNAAISLASFLLDVGGFGESSAANASVVRQVDIISLMRSWGRAALILKSCSLGLPAIALVVRPVAVGNGFIIIASAKASPSLAAWGFQFIAVLIIEMV